MAVFGDLMLPPPEGTKLVAVYAKPAGSGLRGAIGGIRRDAEAIYLLGGWKSGLGGRSSIFTTRRPLVGGKSCGPCTAAARAQNARDNQRKTEKRRYERAAS